MDRIEIDAIADDHGWVHVATGIPGSRVHIILESASIVDDLPAALQAFDAACAALRSGVTIDHQEVSELRHEGHA